MKTTTARDHSVGSSAERERRTNWTPIAAILLVSVIALKLAWLADDAAITARVIANFLDGYGPNFNIGERAQAFTHPLWFLLNAALSVAVGDIALTLMITGVVCTGLTTWLLVRGRSSFASLVVAGVFGLSFTLADFASSGLENPLTWLLLLSMWSAARSDKLALAALFGGLALVNRLDLAIVVGPFLGLIILDRSVALASKIRTVGFATLPPLIWAAFSTGYYGAPLPETFFAKLNAEIPTVDLISQGLFYVYDLFRYDLVTGVTIVVGIHLAWTSQVSRTTRLFVLAGGLYAAYVVVIGGDFMSGRFWSVTAMTSLVAIVERADTIKPGVIGTNRQIVYGLAAVLIASALLVPPLSLPLVRSPILSPERGNAHGRENSGVVDEWHFYATDGRTLWQSILGEEDGLDSIRRSLAAWEPDSMITTIDSGCGNAGRRAIEGGPETHYVIDCGLSDPFLARIPFNPDGGPWRIGHFHREIPQGYFDSLADGEPNNLDPRYIDLFESTTAERRISDRWGDVVSISTIQIEESIGG